MDSVHFLSSPRSEYVVAEDVVVVGEVGLTRRDRFFVDFPFLGLLDYTVWGLP